VVFAGVHQYAAFAPAPHTHAPFDQTPAANPG